LFLNGKEENLGVLRMTVAIAFQELSSTQRLWHELKDELAGLSPLRTFLSVLFRPVAEHKLLQPVSNGQPGKNMGACP
jgi:hypothetical protein